MTNHYDEMRVSPDPSQAEELRQRLHAHMANTSTDDRRGRSALEPDSDGHPDEWSVPMHELSPPDTATPDQRTHRRRVMVAAAAIVVAIAAAGIVSRIEDPSGVAATAPTSPTAASAGSGCPLTAEEVSRVIGATVVSTDSCQFDNSLGGSFPSVSFAYQSASACTQENLREAGFLDPNDPAAPGVGAGGTVGGFGVDAYSHIVSLGRQFIVCDGDHPFVVTVDGVDGDDVAVAIALATLVRDG